MVKFNLTEIVDTQFSTPTVKHDSGGYCFLSVTSTSTSTVTTTDGSTTTTTTTTSVTTKLHPIEAIWIEVDDVGVTTVQLNFEPLPRVDEIDDSITEVTMVPNGYGSVVWDVDTTTTTRTITLGVPMTAGEMWGYDFSSENDPPPLKMKVRVKRL